MATSSTRGAVSSTTPAALAPPSPFEALAASGSVLAEPRRAATRASRSACAAAAWRRAAAWSDWKAASSSGERTAAAGAATAGERLLAMYLPSITASAITRHMSWLARMASSLPGITYWTRSGSQLVSTTATTGMPSLLASATARCSFFVSSTKTASGRRPMLRMPDRLRSSFSSSRPRISASFLGMASNSPESRMRWYSCILATRLAMVSKLVSMPPSQRWLM